MAFDITKINDVAQVAADITNGRSLQGYSTEDGNKLVYDALVDAARLISTLVTCVTVSALLCSLLLRPSSRRLLLRA